MYHWNKELSGVVQSVLYTIVSQATCSKSKKISHIFLFMTLYKLQLAVLMLDKEQCWFAFNSNFVQLNLHL